ncbi:cation diffusion facilitator family transporter [Pseudoglutamicibacter albus]|uniref:Cation diffusion facilitator family transporter n=1 Tax=Pseudoglutamicibacter cumminsii TaxID=156979 RepID=A0AAP4FDQ1_9MICC|nr:MULTISPECIES: cation diffusion facilitator family transporter [Pseudoglutamicibacter]MDK6275456.1 cation diffusion facilitator family transporter [Pseudoglutamicibacter cumminsii]MDZ3744444.1 cation diffusion facilitator family transporter [Pseudoglutamicibacter cumminsii]PKY80821.1 cation transporter [Pseudoglutamicibacter albus]WIK84918.1 cation diffusion facilitator family transporter [Pseudoglutamicibacter albus]
MSGGHEHGPSPEQAAASPDFRRKLAIAFGLVFSIVVAQAIGAWVTGSLALLVDVVHSLTDSIGLLVALIAAVLMVRPANSKRTWGFRRIEVLAALGQALLLAGVSIYAFFEAIDRWNHPPEVAGPELLVFGVIGLVLNIAAALVLASGRKANFNMRAAFLEVLMDALGTVAVIVSAILIMTTGFQRADTLAAVAIALMIIPRALLLIRETTGVLMEFTPKGLDLDDVRTHLLDLEHVQGVHDLHASTVATGLPTLSAHIVLDEQCFQDGHALEVLQAVRHCVAEHFPVGIEHSTFQLETSQLHANEPAHVIHP